MDGDLREWTGWMLHLNTSKIGFARRQFNAKRAQVKWVSKTLRTYTQGLTDSAPQQFLYPLSKPFTLYHGRELPGYSIEVQFSLAVNPVMAFHLNPLRELKGTQAGKIVIPAPCRLNLVQKLVGFSVGQYHHDVERPASILSATETRP